MERANIGETTLAFELAGRGEPVVLSRRHVDNTPQDSLRRQCVLSTG
jgi:hypothetical protein